MRKDRKPKARQVASPSWVAPFAPRMVRRLKYCETVALVEGAVGAGALYVFTPSSLFDPNNTGTGHQPMFFDQLCTSTGPYTRYRVLSVRAKVSIISSSAPQSLVGLYLSPSLSTGASQVANLEKPAAQWKQLTPYNCGIPIATFAVAERSAKMLGITEKHLLDDDNYAGYYNSSPGINYALTLFAYGLSGVVFTGYATVELDLEAEFFSIGNTVSS